MYQVVILGSLADVGLDDGEGYSHSFDTSIRSTPGFEVAEGDRDAGRGTAVGDGATEICVA